MHTALFGPEELQPESRFRLALKRLIGAASEEETKAAILDLEEALRLILEKRDKEWQALLQERGQGTPSYQVDLKGFAAELANEVAGAVDARIDAKVASRRMPSGGGVPADVNERLSALQEQITQLRETIKGELKPEVRTALKSEVRTAIAGHMEGDDELSRIIAELVKELRDQLTVELKAELTEEVKEAIKDEIKKELKKELL